MTSASDVNPGMKRAADRFRRDMQKLNLGVSIKAGDGPWVKVTDPPDTTKEDTMAETFTDEVAGALDEAGIAYQRDAQLTFDVGGDLHHPAGASLNITGKGIVNAELFMDDDVTIRVVDAQGEVVASYDGTVTGVHFVKHKETETETAWVERVHKIKLGE